LQPQVLPRAARLIPAVGVSLLVRWLAVVAVFLAARAATAAEDPAKASTSAAARADAARLIPLAQLDPQVRRQVTNVVKHAGIFRRLPTTLFPCDHGLYAYLVRHPEVIVNLWQVMGVTQVTIERLADGSYKAADGAGTSCSIRYVHSGDGLEVIYAEGAYSGPLFRHPVRAKCVLVLKTVYLEAPDGRKVVQSRMDCFVHVENSGLELIAKTVQPLVGKTADHNFTESSAFFGMLSRAAYRNNDAVARLASRLSKIEPQTRNEFAGIVRQAAAPTASSAGDVTTASAPAPARSSPPKR
jgi:hypothetical protein